MPGGKIYINRILPSNIWDALLGANAPSAANVFATMADIGGAVTWAAVLAVGAASGGTSPIITSGDSIVYNNSGFTASISEPALAGNIVLTLPASTGTFALLSDIVSPALASTEIGFGSGANLLTGSANLTWDDAARNFNAAGTIGIALNNTGNVFYVAQGNVGFWYTGAASTGLLAHQGFGIDFKTNEIYTMGAWGLANGTYIEANDTAQTITLSKATTVTGTLGASNLSGTNTGDQTNVPGTAGNVTGIVAIANGGTGQATAVLGFNALSPLTAIGDIIYHNGTDNVRLPGNITSTQKFLSQTGDGSLSAAPSWQTIPSAGLATYFFYKIASDIVATGGYWQEQTTASVGAAQTFTTLVTANADTLIAAFATNIGFPNITFMPSGVFTVYVTARKDVAAAKTCQIVAEFYQRTSGGVETLLGTTAVSIVLTNVDGSFIIQGAIPSSIVLVATDRLVTKIYVRSAGAGGATNCILTVEDLTASRIEIPSATVDATNFVPYSGALYDVDLGSKNITTTGTGAFGTSTTTPIIIGGSTPTSKIRYDASTNAGVTATALAHNFKVGNSAAVQAMGIYHNGHILVNTAVDFSGAIGQMAIVQGTSAIQFGEKSAGIFALYFTGTAVPIVPSATNFALSGTGASTTISGTTNVIMAVTNSARITATASTITFATSAVAAGATNTFLFTRPAHTNQTLSTETIGWRYNGSATLQHATGALTTQREVVFDAPTYSFVGASTISDAATLAITGAPILGTNATFTRSMALWVQSGATRLDGDFVSGNKVIDTTAGDAATINSINGRFRKDTTGTTFTLTNSFITANSIILLTPANAAIDVTATYWTVSAGAGSATITFVAAPTANFDVNFFVIN